MRTPFPLQWPDGWSRTPSVERGPSRFRIPLGTALDGMLDELARLGASNVVITSDLPARRDGRPYADGRGGDPGIAVWFDLGGQERVFACDRWETHAENVRAITRSIEAIRGLDRWGAGEIVTRALSGFKALPSGDAAPAADWRAVFGPYPELSRDQVAKMPRALRRGLLAHLRAIWVLRMRTAHPDHGGSAEAATTLNQAFEQAQRELA